jgi:hypothetical protein
VAALLLGGCQVTTAVGVDARADGSGTVRATVTLDKDAAGRVPDLASKLRVGDLRAAGWRIDGPVALADGGARVQASKSFATPRQAEAVVAELAGPQGPFRRFTLRRERSFAKTRLAFRGDVDLTRGLGSFSDEQLRARLGGSDLGFDPAELQGKLGRALAQVFPVTVAVRLPGAVTSNAPGRAGNGAEWKPSLGEQVVLTAASEQWNTKNLAFAALALLSALALLTTLALLTLRSS